MSISERLEALLKEGKLMERPSTYLNISSRGLFLPPDIEAETRAPFTDMEEERYAEISGFFDAFSEGKMVTVCQRPRKKPPDSMLARVDPISDEFWAMRITDPSETPGARLIGAFCGADMFAGLAFFLREKTNFSAEVDEARRRWRDLFGDQKPHRGGSLNDYISNFTEY